MSKMECNSRSNHIMAGSTSLTSYVIYTSELIALQGRRKISESNDDDELHISVHYGTTFADGRAGPQLRVTHVSLFPILILA